MNIKKWLKQLLWLAFSGLILGVLIISSILWYYGKDLPDFEKIEDYSPPQMSKVYDRSGVQIGRFFKVRRTMVSQKEISPFMIQALLSAEDADFYKHQGLDYWGMLRAIYNSVKAGRLKGSGSTITQQTIKNILLTQEKTLSRKVKEIILTRRIESRFKKDEILNMYLNTIYFGHGRYGIEEASLFYYGKRAKDLTLQEAATIAGLIQSPELHSPRRRPESALRRRTYVLKQMKKNGYITAEEYGEAVDQALEVVPWPEPSPTTAQWWVQEVGKQLQEHLKKRPLKTSGLVIQTTLDLTLQYAAQQAVERGLRAIDQRQRLDRPLRHLETQDQIDRWLKKKKRSAKGLSPPINKRVRGLVTQITSKGRAILSFGVGRAQLHPQSQMRLKKAPVVGDVYPVVLSFESPRHPELMSAHLHLPQAAFIAIDPHTREVLAMVGGWSFSESSFNRVVQARRQPGSSFKPFVYGVALESKRFTLASQLLDAPETWSLGGGQRWTPQNYNKKYLGPILLRKALAKSINSIAVRLADSVGLSQVKEFAQRVGIQDAQLVDNLTLALGSSEVSPMELVNAYATFANGGRFNDPILITSVQRSYPSNSPEEWMNSKRDIPAISEDLAWVIQRMLRSVVTEGSATRLKRYSGAIIGKTGTSNKAKDAWFIGSLPRLTFGVWVGYDTPRPLGKKETGGKTAAPIILTFLTESKWRAEKWLSMPEGVLNQQIDPITGLIAHSEVKSPRTEYFLLGTEPTKISPKDEQVMNESDLFLFGGDGEDGEDGEEGEEGEDGEEGEE